MSSLHDEVGAFIERHGLLEAGAQVVAGLSGGVDSVVLVHVLLRLGYDVRAAHVNYGLRGADSDGDEAFVRDWCSSLGVPLEVARFDTRAEATMRQTSLQDAARALRYAFFDRVAAAAGCRYVAVGHHLDDQAETVLLNLFRGAGPEGLAGMPAWRPLAGDTSRVLVRPLLGVRRRDVEAYARAEGLSWRTDASNESSAYRRGALRTAILPLVEAHFGEAVGENVARAAGLVRAYLDATLHPSLDAAFDALAVADEVGGGGLDLDGLLRLAPVWRHRVILEALRRWLPAAPQRAALAETVAALLAAQPGRRLVLPGGTVWRERNRLVFAPAVHAGVAGNLPVGRLGMGDSFSLPGGTLHLERLDARPSHLDPGTANVAFVDASRLQLPLIVRPWRPGDRFQPLGMAQAKKVSDFLTDAKVPSSRRQAVYVLVSGGDLVWVVGQRLDHRFRIRPETTAFAKISYLPSRTGTTGRA